MTCFPSPSAVNATSLRALRVRRQGGGARRRLRPGGRALHNPAHVPIIILAAHGPPRAEAHMRAMFLALVPTAATLALPGTPGVAEENDQQLGTVHFATSCNEAAQRRFDRAMRYQHSFWYKASREIFEETLKADPECGIAYWGIALSLWNNPHFAPPAPNLAPALAAIEKGKAVGAKSERERDYINALAVLYTDYDK